jgi:Fe-S-cluster containining protein
MTTRDRIAAAANHVANEADALLADRPDAEACAAFARSSAARIELELDELRADGANVACAAGCAFCCYLRVGAFVHEAFALLDHLRRVLPREQSAPIAERIRANARRLEGLTEQEHYAARIPCAFLVDGRCAAYEARPSACARYHSLSRARCEHAFENPRDMGTPRNSRPVLLEMQAFAAAVDDAVGAALARAGLSAVKAELHGLLAAMLDDPRVLERWLAGTR